VRMTTTLSSTEGKPPLRRAIAKRAGSFHHGDLHRALLEGAMLLLEREGPLGVGLRAAARLAGVSQTAPYRHFADKEAILGALAEQGFRELGARMAAAARAHPDPRAALLAIGETYVSLAAERPHLFRLMFGSQVADETRRSAVLDASLQAYGVLLEAIGAAQRAGVLRPGDPGDIALAHWSAVNGVASLIVDGRLADRLAALGPGGPAALVRQVCEQLFVGSARR
jgi:AcrR family transcriptional regulator